MTGDMLITFLVIARVGCEWVEITQQHYNNPINPSNEYELPKKITEKKELYTNHSINEYQWNKEPTNINSPSKLKTKLNEVMVNKGHQIKNNADTDSLRKEVTGNVKRISHLGKVDRVQLINTPLNTSPMSFKTDFNMNEVNLFKKEFVNPIKTSYNYFVTDHTTSLEATTKRVTDYRKNDHATENISKHYLRNNSVSNFKPLITDFGSLEQTIDINRFHRIPEIKSQIAKEISKQTSKKSNLDILNQKPKVPTRDVLTNITNNVNSEQVKIDQKDVNKSQYDTNSQDIKTSGNEEKEYNAGTSTEKPLPNNEKSNTVEVIVKFVKLVSETISSNTRRGFSSKVRYLEGLKNNLIANIEERIDATWPDDYEKRERRSRATEESARGHLEFPSSETTLMSISFLTFAVFLIKLVLQVIQTYKNKTMMVAPLVVATAGRAAVNYIHKKKQN